MNNILNEEHEITLFHIYPKPDNYLPINNYDTKVHFRKTIEDTDDWKFVVNVEVIHSIDNKQALCVFNTFSKYKLPISKNEVGHYENWHPLIQRSIIECDKLYKAKVKGTYLEGTTVPLPSE